MTAKRILIVGGVAGGGACAARARRLCEACEIVMFERGAYVSFANCGLPYFIGDVIVEEEKLLVATPQLFRDRFRIEVCTETEVLRIDSDRKTIVVRDLKSGEERDEPYDALVLSTGARAIRPPIDGIDLPGIYMLRTIPDSRDIRRVVERGSRALVVGAGYLGLELAENLVRRGLAVTVVEASDQVMQLLDREMAAFVAKQLEANAVDLRLNCRVERFTEGAEGGLIASLSSGDDLAVDAAMICVGVRPETALAVQAGLTLGRLGGIRVDESMQTSNPNIWAVGDVVEVRNVVTGEWQLVPLAGPANRQGRLAAAGIVGATKSGYRGVQGTSVCRVFDLTIAATGVSEKGLKAARIDRYEKVYLHPGNHVGYYPGATPIHIKLLYDVTDGAILGAQALGEEGVARRIDVIAMALQMGGTVYDLEEAELCYAPQFGATKDPVNLAGMIAANHLRGDHPLAKWEELVDAHAQVVDDQSEATRLLSLILRDPASEAQIVDVRSAAEFETKHIPGARNIPLERLRERLSELSREREIWVVCGVGLRAYNATRILLQHGFKVKNLSGGMQTYDSIEGTKSPKP